MTISFRSFKPEQCRKAFRKKGFIEKKKSHHFYYYLTEEGLIRGIFTKISHTNKKSIGKPLFSQIAKDLGVSFSFLQDFIDCDGTYEDLLDILRRDGRLQDTQN